MQNAPSPSLTWVVSTQIWDNSRRRNNHSAGHCSCSPSLSPPTSILPRCLAIGAEKWKPPTCCGQVSGRRQASADLYHALGLSQVRQKKPPGCHRFFSQGRRTVSGQSPLSICICRSAAIRGEAGAGDRDPAKST